jgi:hypothetical protein
MRSQAESRWRQLWPAGTACDCSVTFRAFVEREVSMWVSVRVVRAGLVGGRIAQFDALETVSVMKLAASPAQSQEPCDNDQRQQCERHGTSWPLHATGIVSRVAEAALGLGRTALRFCPRVVASAETQLVDARYARQPTVTRLVPWDGRRFIAWRCKMQRAMPPRWKEMVGS